jgi:hypothetical protein
VLTTWKNIAEASVPPIGRSPTSSMTSTVGAVNAFIFEVRFPSIEARTRVRQRLSAVVK